MICKCEPLTVTNNGYEENQSGLQVSKPPSEKFAAEYTQAHVRRIELSVQNTAQTLPHRLCMANSTASLLSKGEGVTSHPAMES